MTPNASPSISRLHASFANQGGRTRLVRVHESGALRLRRPRGEACEAILVNTGGGIVGGDRLTAMFDLASDATVTVTNVAAEKIYRAAGEPATIDTRLTLGAGARLDWLPQETILFEASRVRRTFAVEMAGTARLLAMETVVFGRLASAEPSICGRFADSWRIRREGRLVFADESRLDGEIGAMLDRPAIAGGARAVALLVLVAPDAGHFVEPARTVLAAHHEVEGGVSERDGILVARALARSPERLRASMVEAMKALRGLPMPRVWA